MRTEQVTADFWQQLTLTTAALRARRAERQAEADTLAEAAHKLMDQAEQPNLDFKERERLLLAAYDLLLRASTRTVPHIVAARRCCQLLEALIQGTSRSARHERSENSASGE